MKNRQMDYICILEHKDGRAELFWYDSYLRSLKEFSVYRKRGYEQVTSLNVPENVVLKAYLPCCDYVSGRISSSEFKKTIEGLQSVEPKIRFSITSKSP